MEDGDPSLPTYTEEPFDFRASIQQLQGSIKQSSLPLTRWPDPIPSPLPSTGLPDYVESTQQWQREIDFQRNIIDSFFHAVQNKNQDVVAMMIEQQLVTPDTTDFLGCSPLVRAVTSEDIRMVQCLVDFGAEIDRVVPFIDTERNPLQVAASRGHLALVRLFIEVFHADDALVAPDGEIALRMPPSFFSGNFPKSNLSCRFKSRLFGCGRIVTSFQRGVNGRSQSFHGGSNTSSDVLKIYSKKYRRR